MWKLSKQEREAKVLLESCRGVQCMEYAERLNLVLREDANGEGVQDTAFVF